MPSLPPAEHVPATPQDALVHTLPIPEHLVDGMARSIMRTVVRRRGCWIRTAYLHANGYSHISRKINGRVRYFLAHRVIYTHYYGPIPEGYTIDHLCEQRACVNPEHLQAVTHRQNVLRSRTNPFAVNARRKTQGAA